MEKEIEVRLRSFFEAIARLSEKQFAKGKRYHDRGLKDGGENIPSTKAVSLGQAETEVFSDTVALSQELTRITEDEVRYFEGLLDSSDTSLNDPNWRTALAHLCTETKAKIERIMHGRRASLVSLCTAQLEAFAYLKRFKRDNSLHHDANYPTSRSAHYFILAAIAVAEAIANGFFYGSVTGLLSGLMLAVATALAIVVVSAFLGEMWRKKNSVHQLVRIQGWASFVAWGAYSFLFMKGIALFRHHVQLNPNFLEATKEAFRQTMNFPHVGFSTMGIESWFLLIIGGIVAVTAFYKGYRADDMYPGFGDAHRAFKAAEDEYQIGLEALRTDITHILTTANDELAKISGEKQEQYNLFVQCARAIGKLSSKYKVEQGNIEANYRHQMKTYRNANLASRTTDAPAYFESVPSLSTVELSLSEDRQQKLAGNHLEMLQGTVKQVIELCANTRHELASLEQTNNDIVDSFVDGVERAAKETIAERNNINIDEKAA